MEAHATLTVLQRRSRSAHHAYLIILNIGRIMRQHPVAHPSTFWPPVDNVIICIIIGATFLSYVVVHFKVIR